MSDYLVMECGEGDTYEEFDSSECYVASGVNGPLEAIKQLIDDKFLYDPSACLVVEVTPVGVYKRDSTFTLVPAPTKKPVKRKDK